MQFELQDYLSCHDQQPTESGNTDPQLADNQAPYPNTELWLVYVQEQYQQNVVNLTSQIEDLTKNKTELETKISDLEKGG